MNPEALPFQPIPAPDEFLANQGFLRRLARELIRDAARAEDLLQDTWLTWRERRPAGLAEPRAWLARVLQNRARNLLRQDQRRAQREQRVARPEAIPSELAQATVDVQAEVVAVLQRLDEPEQTALMLRYYHGLGPTEIAARTGVSLNTVKSRLTRALAHLRAELDRRHAHDHKDWRHCLVPLALPEGGSELAPTRRDGQPVGPRGGGDGLRGPLGLALAGGLCAVAVVIVVAVLVAQGWSRPERPSVALREAGEGTLAPLAAQLLALPASAEPAVGRVAVQPEPLVVPRNPVEWPQFARNAAHDGFDPKLADRIRTPEVLWHVSDTHGQPTLSGQDLYSGGRGLFWIDPNNGTVLARVLQGAPEAHPEKPDEKIVPHSVAHSPAITPDLVLARRTKDGGVTAYDRTLAREVWSWTPESKGYVHFSGCLAGERFIVATIDEVVALNVADGKPAWTFPTAGHGAVNMVPASAQGRVLFGAEDGTFWCLDLVEGHELWRVETGGILGWTNPVVVKDRVVFADRGGTQQGGGDDNADDVKQSRRGEVRCLSLEDGKELWHAAFDMTGFSTPGVGPGYVVGGFGKQVARFDLAKGKISERVATGTNAFGSPTVVGDSLVFGNLDGNLYVHDLESADLRWRFHLGEGQQALDFVHGGDRIYLSTTAGLYCLGDAGSNRKAKKGFVLEAGAPPQAR